MSFIFRRTRGDAVTIFNRLEEFGIALWLYSVSGVGQMNGNVKTGTFSPKEPSGTMSPSPSPKESDRTNRTPWAHLLERVFDHDVLTCDKCGGRRELRAFVSSPALARKALEALGVAFEPLKIAKGHDPPSQESLDFGPGFDGVDGIDPSYPD